MICDFFRSEKQSVRSPKLQIEMVCTVVNVVKLKRGM